MFKRNLADTILKTAKIFPTITLTGPRQSGKTTLLKFLFPDKPYFSMEDPDTRQRMLEDPRGFLAQCPDGAFFDEFQRTPDLPSYLQRLIDDAPRPGQFILSGSQQLEVMNTVSQSLAGRTAILKLLPLSLSELNTANTFTDDQLIIQGFYPSVYHPNADAQIIYKSYIHTYLERDLNQLIHIKDLASFQKFLILCASRVGQVFVASQLANDIGVSVHTIQSWISILQASYIVYLLPPFFANIGKRLTKSSKLYFYDVGLAAHLLRFTTPDQISRDPLKGSLFENMVVMNLIKNCLHAGQEPLCFFYRDQAQTEVDLLFQEGSRYKAIEIKSSQTFQTQLTRPLQTLERYLGSSLEQKIHLYAGKENFIHQDITIQNWRTYTPNT